MTAADLAQAHEVVAEDLEYGRVDGTPLVARLYRPHGITGFASAVNVPVVMMIPLSARPDIAPLKSRT